MISRHNIETELAAEDLKHEQEEAQKQLRRLEKKHKGKPNEGKQMIKLGREKNVDGQKKGEEPIGKRNEQKLVKQVPRGKRGKLKRVKEKYKDQVRRKQGNVKRNGTT